MNMLTDEERCMLESGAILSGARRAVAPSALVARAGRPVRRAWERWRAAAQTYAEAKLSGTKFCVCASS